MDKVVCRDKERIKIFLVGIDGEDMCDLGF